MKMPMCKVLLTAAVALMAGALSPAVNAEDIPKSWIDKDTGHRVIRLSEEPGSRSLYFHQNAYSADGNSMVISVDNPRGIAVVNLKDGTVKRLFEDPDAGILFMGPASRDVYVTRIEGAGSGEVVAKNELQQPTEVLAINIDNGRVRHVATVPRGKIHSINKDESLLIGAFAEREYSIESGPRHARFEARYEATGKDGKPLTFAEAKEVRINERLEARIPMEMFVVDTQTGEQRTIHKATDWLNHIQFSPADPDKIMFCHEGPWHKVDRIWTMNVDGSHIQKMHTRSMNMEIAGHEFFDHSGSRIFYDLQTPRGEVFWLASVDLSSGERIWRHMPRDYWSVHFNISPDGKLFAGDGGDEEMVARAKDGKWIYLFRDEPINDVAGISAPDAASLIKPATLQAERLVNMADHDYRLEPNVTFTPDNKWVVFRSNMHGPVHVYAVEVARAQQP
ncbi:oligogalacturonate lyase family protein [Alteromonas sp. RKMC-009]|uniref:oligogalacturonate lyase family protein n=1 Tax=Alteromonas sp. RKMC-009 TaxID=2267264 RepID=UPI001930EA57|nr:oligogalacturonate lyase family protein [Alteromonas sp. RKMC-009]